MEVNLRKPLKSGYRMRREFWRIQFEGLHDICFDCGRYRHRALTCPDKEAAEKVGTATVGSKDVNPESGPSEGNTNACCGD